VIRAELKQKGLKEAIERLQKVNKRQMPAILGVARRARRKIKTLAAGFFEFRVEERRRSFRSKGGGSRPIRTPIVGAMHVRPNAITMSVGSAFRLVAYHERGASGPAIEGRSKHQRATRGAGRAQIRQHALDLDIPARRFLDSATDRTVPGMQADLRRSLELVNRGQAAPGGAGA
jgi:hypothetical protein